MNTLWLLTDWDENSNLYRGLSNNVSNQISVHSAKRFQMRRLKCEKLTEDELRMPSDGIHYF